MEHTAMIEGMEDLESLAAEIAARVSHLPLGQRGDAIARVERLVDQLIGVCLDQRHQLSLDTLPTDFNAVEHAHETLRITRREAVAQCRLGAELADRYHLIGLALRDGRMSVAQVSAVVRVLRRTPLGVDDLVQAQQVLIDHADKFDPSDLAEIARHIAELLDPDAADAEEANRLEHEERIAEQERFLTVEPDHHGSIRIAGKVTPMVGATLIAQLDALMPPPSFYTGGGPAPTMATRWADALEQLLGIAAATGDLPEDGGDRPRVIVTVNYDTLVRGLGHATLTGVAEDITPAKVRSLACDAGIIPAVLGSASQPLDVGRENRSFPRTIRIALIHRDRGCAFPGCNVSYAACDAHHIVPWWAGGASSLSNGVLLCPFHHRAVEPDPNRAPEHQWQVVINPGDGLPEFIPPRTVDPERRARRHRRHQSPGRAAATPTSPPAEPRVWRSSPAWRTDDEEASGTSPPPAPRPKNPWHPDEDDA